MYTTSHSICGVVKRCVMYLLGKQRKFKQDKVFGL